MKELEDARAALASFEAAMADPEQDLDVVRQTDAEDLAEHLRRVLAAVESLSAPPTEDEAAEVDRIIREQGLDDNGASPHGWRCEHPDRYPGYCTCVADLRDAIVASPAWRNRHREPITDETVTKAAHAAYLAGAGAFANMFVIERWMRAALEAAESTRTASTEGSTK